MAVVTSAALTPGGHTAVMSAYVVLGAWAIVCRGARRPGARAAAMTAGVVGARPRHVPQTELRSGVGYWVASLASMMRFDYGRVRQWVPMMIVIQTLMGAGMALLYGFFYPQITAIRALYITTGAPTLALVPARFRDAPGHGRRAEARRDVRLHLVAALAEKRPGRVHLHSLHALRPPGLGVRAPRGGVAIRRSPCALTAARPGGPSLRR